VRLAAWAPGQRDSPAVCATPGARRARGRPPFGGDPRGPTRFTAVDYRHRHLLRAMPGLLRGKPNGYLKPEHGYASCNADRIVLELTSGCTLDGELIHPAPSTPLRLSAEHSVRFVRP
jgi:hypothetical protein